jgi:hypothetical protein
MAAPERRGAISGAVAILDVAAERTNARAARGKCSGRIVDLLGGGPARRDRHVDEERAERRDRVRLLDRAVRSRVVRELGLNVVAIAMLVAIGLVTARLIVGRSGWAIDLDLAYILGAFVFSVPAVVIIEYRRRRRDRL